MHTSRRSTLGAVAVLLLVLVTTGVAQETPAIDDDLKAAVDSMIQAFEQAKFDDLEGMTAPEVTVVLGFEAAPQVMTVARSEFVTELQATTGIEVDDESVAITQMGVVATVSANVDVEFPGQRMPASTLLILAKEGGQWWLGGLIAGPRP